MLKTTQKADDGLYIAGWAVLAALCLLLALTRLAGIDPSRLLRPCLLHVLTGYYCPGCGGTRAVRALLAAKPIESFICHPMVPYTAALGIWFMASQTVERISRGRIRIGMHFREIYLWIALGLLLINFLVKNLALFFWDVDLLAGTLI